MPDEEKKEFYFYHFFEDGDLKSVAADLFKDEYADDEILSFEDNKEAIYSCYNDEDKKQYSEAVKDLVRAGTNIKLPLLKVQISNEKFQKNENIKSTGILKLNEAYWSSNVKDWLDKKINELNYKNTQEYFIKKPDNKAYVKVWSRANEETLDITKFVDGLNTNVDSNGGNFNFALPAIEAKWDSGKWKMDNVLEYNGGKEVYSKTHVFKNRNVSFNLFGANISNSLKVSGDFFFEKILNAQDLIFIKYDEPFKNPDDISYPFNDEYDFIGLIDSVKVTKRQNENNIDIYISISGRDLMKVFVEDGTYYYPIETFVGESIDSKPVCLYNDVSHKAKDRIFGKLYDIKINGNKPIFNLIEFIIQKIRNTTLEIPFSSGQNGIWDIIDVEIEEEAGKRLLYDSSISTYSGSVINFIKKICQEPFVEVFGDTFGSKYKLIIRTPPFSKKTFTNNRTLEIGIRHLISEDTTVDDKTINSWFRFTPNSIFFGDSVAGSVLFPAVYFEKLAIIYGSKKFEAVHNYFFGNKYKNLEDEETRIDAKVQSVEDLKYLLESYTSSSFMKRGTLIFKNVSGIKRGINIYIPETDMLYYVNSYTNNFEINDRITTVQVERGIPKKAIDIFYDLVTCDINTQNNSLTNIKFNEEYYKKILRKKYD